MDRELCIVLIVCISLYPVLSQIVFNDETERGTQSQSDLKSQESLDYIGDEGVDPKDYYDELVNGHRARHQDGDKFKRQEGCLCIKHLSDPHCGSDNKLYDNGCYFDCAQKRNPRLYLANWGPCS